eukprot:418588-Prymnesium_polylepis.1
MSTVLADLGRHHEALDAAQEAIRVLTANMVSTQAPAEPFAKRASPSAVDASLLSAAYHNLAVQQERLGATQVHVHSYRAAALQARRNGAAPAVIDFMRREYASARQRASSGTSAMGSTGDPLGWQPIGGGAACRAASQPAMLGLVDERPTTAQGGGRGRAASGGLARPASQP